MIYGRRNVIITPTDTEALDALCEGPREHQEDRRQVRGTEGPQGVEQGT
jgi:hypothetical protein